MNRAQILRSVFVSVPALRVEDRNGEVSVTNAATGTHAVFGPDIIEVLDFFRRPRALSDWLARKRGPADTAVRAVSHAFLTDVDRMVVPADGAIGRATALSAFLGGDQTGATAIFGVPVDMASTGRGGARMGPREVRAAFRFPGFDGGGATEGESAPDKAAGPAARYLDFDTRRSYGPPTRPVRDLGNLMQIPGEGIATYGPRVAQLCGMILDRGGVPGMLGGDHSCTAFALRPHLDANPALGILHFDAHHDIWPPPAPQYTYVTHASALFGALQSDNLRVLRQLGLRVFDTAAEGQLRDDARLSYFSARELQRMQPQDAFADLPRDIPYYLTFDIDCLDPVHAPETGTPVPGGLSLYQALDLVDHAARTFRIAGWDIVEVGQGDARVNAAATCAARIAKELLLAGRPFEPIIGYARQV